MARKVSVTKAELEALVEAAGLPGLSTKASKALLALVTKATAPPKEPTHGIKLSDIEFVLLSSEKYARWSGGNPSRYLQMLNGHGADAEKIADIGTWVERQGWIREYDLSTLARNYPSWLARSQHGQATPPPKPTRTRWSDED